MASMVVLILLVMVKFDVSVSTCKQRLDRTLCKGPVPQFPPETKLVEVMISQCDFDVLPNSTFDNVLQLQTIIINCNRHIQFQAGWTHPLSASGLIEMRLDNNFISELPSGSFCNLNILKLTLDKNLIEQTETLGFGDDGQLCKVSPVLRELSVNNNRIRSLPDGVFSQLKQLVTLHLANNFIEQIHPKAFRNLTSLIFLDLSNNKLSYIGDTVFRGPLTTLKTLNLSTNHLTSTSYFDFPSTLEELELDNNRIETIEAKVDSQLIHLRIVNLSNNRLTSLNRTQLPPYFTTLYLDNNNISTLEPNTFGGGANTMRFVSLRNNSLQHLCHTWLGLFYEFSIIKPLPLTLYISGNPFRCNCEFAWVYDSIGHGNRQNYPLIPDLEQVGCTAEIPTVQTETEKFWCGSSSWEEPCQCYENYDLIGCTMTCSHNCTCYLRGRWKGIVTQCQRVGLTSVPKEAHQDTTVLFIQDNFVKILKANDFFNYRKLETLFIQRSNLSYIEDFAFSHLSKLEDLRLDFNQLQTLSNNTFAGLTKLKKLFLNDNQLQTIDDNAFQQLDALQELYLSNNRLVQYPVWNLTAISTLRRVTIDNNPWSCDCEFVEIFQKWLLNPNDRPEVSTKNVACRMTADMSTIPMVAINDTVCLKMNNNESGFSVTMAIVGSIIGVFVIAFVIAILIFFFRFH